MPTCIINIRQIKILIFRQQNFMWYIIELRPFLLLFRLSMNIHIQWHILNNKGGMCMCMCVCGCVCARAFRIMSPGLIMIKLIIKYNFIAMITNEKILNIAGNTDCNLPRIKHYRIRTTSIFRGFSYVDSVLATGQCQPKSGDSSNKSVGPCQIQGNLLAWATHKTLYSMPPTVKYQ